MSTIVLRQTKGTPLTIVEVDANFNNLNNDKLEKSGGTLTGVLTSNVATGTAPFTVASTTLVANLNTSLLGGATFAAPGPIGSTTASTGAFTTVSSNVATGTAPFTVASTTAVTNLSIGGNAGTVTTNANLTGMVTSVGNAATVVTNANLTGMVTSIGNAATVVTNANLTGGVTSVGNAATVVTNANLTGAVTSVGNLTSLGGFTSAQLLNALTGVIVGNYTGTGLNVFANNPTLTNPALGTPSALVGTNITGTAASLTAGAVTNGVYTTGTQTIGGSKTFSSTVLLADGGVMFASDGGQDTGISWASDGVMNVRCNASTVGQFNSTGFTGNAATVTNGITTANYNSYSPTLTGGSASGSWGISVTGSSASCTGNAASATTATNQSGGTVNATTITGSSDATINGLTVGKGGGTGAGNTAMGNGALLTNNSYYNTAYGYSSNSANQSGNNNTTIGYNTQTSVSGSSNEIVIGSTAQGFGAFYVTIGNGTNYIYNKYNTNATWTRVSDVRLKTNIQPADIGLSFINRLNIKTYNWRPSYDIPKELKSYSEENTQDTDTVMYGMLAQDVKAALDAENVEHFAGWDVSPKDGSQAVSMEMFVLPLINAIKELTTRLEALEGNT